MLTIILRLLKDRRTSLIIYFIATIALLLMFIGIFPSLQSQSVDFESLLKAYPEGLKKAFNVDIKSMTTIEGFLSMEHFSLIWPVMLTFLLVSFAGGSIAGEVEKGTIETLLSGPISRTKLFFAKYFTGLIVLILFTFLSILGAIPLIEVYDISYNANNFYSMFILGLMFGWAVYSISMFFSSIFSDKGKVYALSGGLLVVMYVLNILSSFKENLANVKYASFFYYYNASEAMMFNRIDNYSYLVFIATGLVFTILALIFFTERDIST